MIPLSLYISMELVRLGQSYFMIRDTEMYDAGSNSKFQCRALNINEDLGQIKYLFSDKTGTLTENKMEFHTASIDGVDYSNTKVVIEPATGKIEGSITPEDSRFVEG
jgi:phospholipid-transporting ATPase